MYRLQHEGGLTLRKLDTIDVMGERGTADALSLFEALTDDCNVVDISLRKVQVQPASPAAGVRT